MPDFHSVLYQIVGSRIIELRKFNNDTQEQLAKKIGLKRSSISNIEQGRQQVSLHLLYRISQVYSTEIYSLLPRVNDLAGKVSLELDNVREMLKEKEVGTITQKKIFERLNS